MAHSHASAGASPPAATALHRLQGWVSFAASGVAAAPPPALTRVAPQSRGSVKPGQKVVVGICALEKKARVPRIYPQRRAAALRRALTRCAAKLQAKSKPMTQILERLLAYGEFTVVYFGDACIHDAPVEAWPLCDCLISFYSENFPLAKAEAYAQLRKPFVLNDLSKQHWLLDRRKVCS